MHPQAQGLLAGMAEAGAPPIYDVSLEEARAVTRGVAELIGPGPELENVFDIQIPLGSRDIGARVYEPVEAPTTTVVYYHGGGWVIGCVEDWDAMCRTLAAESEARVVSVDYRLAPEHPFPAAADDAYDAFVWVAENLGRNGPLVVAGDSAGGNLAAVTALRARDQAGPEIALQVLVYPIVDHDVSTGSYLECADSGLILNPAEMVWFWDQYVPDRAERSHPYASPLRASDHTGLPPAYIVVAGYDPLHDEDLAYAGKLQAAGVPVEVRRFDDQIHAFFLMVDIMESADTAVAEAGAAIRAATSAA